MSDLLFDPNSERAKDFFADVANQIPDEEFYTNHLNRVSRSFAACIAELDQPMRPWVSMTYLLCRWLDTIEDAAWASSEAQELAFSDFVTYFEEQLCFDPNQQSSISPTCTTALLALDNVTEAERSLIGDAPVLLAKYSQFPERVREIIACLVIDMASGMQHFAGASELACPAVVAGAAPTMTEMTVAISQHTEIIFGQLGVAPKGGSAGGKSAGSASKSASVARATAAAKSALDFLDSPAVEMGKATPTSLAAAVAGGSSSGAGAKTADVASAKGDDGANYRDSVGPAAKEASSVAEASSAQNQTTSAPVRNEVVRLKSLRELNQYCFFVAGIVGEALTDLLDEAAFIRTENTVGGHAFGLFLQKINVLKDQYKDEAEGRFFVANRAEVIESLLVDAKLAFEYIMNIPVEQRGYRKFCAWSYFLGLATLPLLLMQTPEQLEPKLDRDMVTGLFTMINVKIDSNEQLLRLYFDLTDQIAAFRAAAGLDVASAASTNGETGGADGSAIIPAWVKAAYGGRLSSEQLSALGL